MPRRITIGISHVNRNGNDMREDLNNSLALSSIGPTDAGYDEGKGIDGRQREKGRGKS